MSFIKKYSILLIPAGIALLGAVFIVLTILTSGSLAKDIEQKSVRAASTLDRIKPVPKGQAAVEKVYQDAYAKGADQVELLARHGSMRELLSYLIFVKDRDSSQQLFDEYGENYRAGIEGLVRSMKALSAPSASEIEKEVGAGTTSGTAGRPATNYGGDSYDRGGYGRGDYSSRPVLSTSRSQSQNARNAMIEAVCSKRAEDILVYANPNLFKWYEYWGDFQYAGADSAVKDCWYSQMAYWIYDDVVATINKMNEGSENVYSSPVKRLVGVSFQHPVEYQVIRSGYGGTSTRSSYSMGGYRDGFGANGDAPDYVLDKNGGVLGVEPWTARICDDDVDVVHFSMGVLTSSSSVMSFMRELCSVKEHRYRKGFKENGEEIALQHNQITILKSDVLSVDTAATEHEHFRYGDEAIVRVDLVCEYILPRAGYDEEIKPDSIKELLGQLVESDDAAAAPGGNMGGRAIPRMPAGGTRPGGGTNLYNK